jgi:hypothetical protein
MRAYSIELCPKALQTFLFPQDIKNTKLEPFFLVENGLALEAKMHATFLTSHHVRTRTSQLDVGPFLFIHWICLLMRPTMELAGGIHHQRRQRHVKPGLVVEPTLETTSSWQERHAVNSQGFLLQVRRRGGLLICRACGIIILERPLLSRPILNRVQMSISDSLVPVVMGSQNRYPLQLTIPLHQHIRVYD